jgi:hypothetical protein
MIYCQNSSRNAYEGVVGANAHSVVEKDGGMKVELGMACVLA